MIKSQNQIINSNLNDIFQEMDLNHLAKSQIPIFFLNPKFFKVWNQILNLLQKNK